MRTKILAVMLVLLFSGCTRGPLGRMMRSGEVQEYYAANPSTPAEVRQAIDDGRIMLGMSWEQVRLSIGNPRRVNTTRTAFGTHEQLIYPGNLYVYLDNDVVTAVQE